MDNDAIQDLFSGLGPVTIKRMFGGKAIYFQGLIVALEVQNEILLKADEVSAPAFEAAGSRQWRYERKSRKPVDMPYWSIPDDAFDDPDIMTEWAKLAHEASLRRTK
ncbi:MAG: TfoX/Sxy family protein [Phyllobacterium sp.]|jgi:DNA transformation protein|uniref:TfoX/Sxy family protein n=1 Tax=Phyllobacterium sp. TaxID=1871046 RepID=UPI0030F2F2DC